MNNIVPWIRIFLATFIYVFFAVLASVMVQKTGGNLREMKGRTSQRILIIGTIINFFVLASSLLFLTLVDGRAISELGLILSMRDMVFCLVGIVILFAMSLLLVGLLRQSSQFQVWSQKPLKNGSEIYGLTSSIMALFIVAVTEEVLFRGYITLNLLSFGPYIVIFVSTLLFAAVHLLTNRANLYQIMSWILIGAVLSIIYLISGSIWVPIILHFAIDLTNMLVFNITGRFSIFKIVPSVSALHRTMYRVAYIVVLMAVLLAFYDPTIKLI